jgi:hypothetical protein
VIRRILPQIIATSQLVAFCREVVVIGRWSDRPQEDSSTRRAKKSRSLVSRHRLAIALLIRGGFADRACRVFPTELGEANKFLCPEKVCHILSVPNAPCHCLSRGTSRNGATDKRVRAGANDTHKREMGHPAIQTPRPMQKHRRNNPARRTRQTHNLGKNRIRLPKHITLSKKASISGPVTATAILPAEICLTDEMPAMSKSNRLRIELSRTEVLFAMFIFFAPQGVRGVPFT